MHVRQKVKEEKRKILGQWGLSWVHESALPVANDNPKILVDNGKKLLSFDDRSSGQPRFGSILLFVFFFFLYVEKA